MSALALLLASAASAAADTTIGQTGGNHLCFAGFVAADTSYAVPAGGGVITSFSYGNDGNNAGSQLDFEVLQPNSDGSYTIVAHTGLETLAGANGDETFPAQIPVSGGEIIGYYETGTDNCLNTGGTDNIAAAYLGSDPAPGQTLDASLVAALPGYALNESADLSSAAPTLSAAGGNVSGTEGEQTSGQVATFSDPDNQAPGDYSATIDWGDGSTSSGVVSQTSPGQYAVNGAHTYAEYGSSVVAVRVSDKDGATSQAQGAATVADAPISASGVGSSANPAGTQPSFSGQLATLTDQNPAGSPGDFTATIDWGDGTSSNGSVAGAGGSYTVSGSHSYAADGPYTVKVHVDDAGGSSADATSDLIVYERADRSGGSFVIGDVVTRPAVYFWGGRWSAENPMSGGPAPASFKGFADGSAQSCGQRFTALPGEDPAAPTTVPAYMAVAVAGNVSKSGRQISGTVEKVVVVKTDAGYGRDGDSAGLGEIVATLCG